MLHSRAIVLSTTDFGECDRYVQLFTQKWGVISVLAKAARKSKKRYVGGLDLFCHNEVFLRGDPKERPYLQELVVLNSFQYLRADLDKLLIAGRVLQWLRKIANQTVPMAPTFSLLGQMLSLIENESQKEKLEALMLVFKAKLLTQLGYKPRLDSCVHCGAIATQKLYLFDISTGGIVCEKCFQAESSQNNLGLRMHERQFIHSIITLKLKDWSHFSIDPINIRSLSQLLTQFGTYHLHTKLPF